MIPFAENTSKARINGRATVARLKHETFSIHPAASRVTLQLVSARGRYAGPVIVSATRSRVLEGVKAGEEIDVDVSGRSPSSGDNAGVNFAFRIR